MRANFILALTVFCLVASWDAVVFFKPELAGFAGVRIGRLCFYNGICSRAVGASVLTYPAGSGVDVYFQHCGEMVENEATYVGGNHTFGFGRHFRPKRMWLCMPLWAVATLWTIQFWIGFQRRALPIGIGAALAVVALWGFPMRAISMLTWSTGLLFLMWIAMAMRALREYLLKRQGVA